ncbi:g4439 [Coccomyxa elongata]
MEVNLQHQAKASAMQHWTRWADAKEAAEDLAGALLVPHQPGGRFGSLPWPAAARAEPACGLRGGAHANAAEILDSIRSCLLGCT